jgi:(p)ppGpp synthase/HD superfamily hydrolase
MHAAQTKAGSSVPYLGHLLGTCSIALEHGADEDEAIAALLHDAIEDVEPADEARAVVWSFGPRVGRIVEACTDSDVHPKPPWRERKLAYLGRVGDADASTLLVSASDKLHNARRIVSDVRRLGPPAWSRFSAPPDQLAWYYRSLVIAFRANPAHRPGLVDELERAVVDLERLAADSR